MPELRNQKAVRCHKGLIMSDERVRKCYGRIGIRKECRGCGIRMFCRDFAESERALSVGKSCVVGIPEWIPAASLSDRPDPELKYTEEDMQEMIRFFLTLSAEDFQILQIRIEQPEIANAKIAEKLKIDRKRIYEFFKRETMRRPGLSRVLYRQKKKKESKNGMEQ